MHHHHFLENWNKKKYDCSLSILKQMIDFHRLAHKLCIMIRNVHLSHEHIPVELSAKSISCQ